VSNILTTNPLQFDTAGATSEVAAHKIITGFAVIASADTWEVVVHDVASGTVIFRMISNVANDRGACCGGLEHDQAQLHVSRRA
jgi:hypothetical protein